MEKKLIGAAVSIATLLGLLLVWRSTWNNFEMNFRFSGYAALSVVFSIVVGFIVATSPLWDEWRNK